MKIIRVFPVRTSATPDDNMVFVGNPPMLRPTADKVHVDCTFTWDKPRAEYLAQAWGQYYPVKLGGVAYDDSCDEFVPGMYVKKGIVFTSRGCNNQCPWCLVWKREGRLREIGVQPGNIIQDNNLLQCSRTHRDKVFTMLKGQHGIEFKGGLDARLVTDVLVDNMRGLRIKQIFLACDTKESIKPLRTAIKRLRLSRQKVRCYALIKFNPNETISEATERMVEIWEAGAMPFAQLYQPSTELIEYPKKWLRFQRTWQRVAAMKSFMGNIPMEMR